MKSELKNQNKIIISAKKEFTNISTKSNTDNLSLKEEKRVSYYNEDEEYDPLRNKALIGTRKTDDGNSSLKRTLDRLDYVETKGIDTAGTLRNQNERITNATTRVF
jgi:hypothetical protein